MYRCCLDFFFLIILGNMLRVKVKAVPLRPAFRNAMDGAVRLFIVEL